MANVNTIKTRILNKYDELANYSNFTPLKGEVCIAVIGETATENQGFKGDITKKPIVGIKVGDGVNKFMDLPWIQAVAGDVSSFVKGIVDEAKFNELVNALIANAQLATKAELKEVSDALAALTTRVTTAEGKITDIETAINTGDNSLANLRQAINTVLGTSADDENANTVYGAKAYAKKQAEAALADAKADAEKYELKNVAAGLVNGLKENEIKANADAITAINAKIGEASIGDENTTITSAIAALQETVGSSGEQSLGSRVEKLEEVVGDSTDGLIKDVADLQAAIADGGDFGKRVVTLEGEMDVVQAATAGYDASKTIASDIQAAKDAAGAAQSQADENKGALEVLIGTVEGDDAMSVRDIAIDVLTEKLIAENADEALNTLEEIAAWIQSHPDNASAMNAAIIAVKQNLGFTGTDLEIAPATVDLRIAEAIDALDIELYAKNDALEAVSGRVEAIEKDYATKAYADGKASAAQAAAEATASADATQKANAAQAAAEATASADATQKANAAQAAAEAKVTALADGQVKTNTDAIGALGAKVNALVESDGNTGMVSGVTQNAETGKITVAHRAITHADLDTNDVFVFYCGNATGYDAGMKSVEI